MPMCRGMVREGPRNVKPVIRLPNRCDHLIKRAVAGPKMAHLFTLTTLFRINRVFSRSHWDNTEPYPLDFTKIPNCSMEFKAKQMMISQAVTV
jgi:hypothetical protein